MSQIYDMKFYKQTKEKYNTLKKFKKELDSISDMFYPYIGCGVSIWDLLKEYEITRVELELEIHRLYVILRSKGEIK
jgi:predicted CopG family antitoxin